MSLKPVFLLLGLAALSFTAGVLGFRMTRARAMRQALVLGGVLLGLSVFCFVMQLGAQDWVLGALWMFLAGLSGLIWVGFRGGAVIGIVQRVRAEARAERSGDGHELS